jgi:predicted amidohydrolase YtcJ
MGAATRERGGNTGAVNAADIVLRNGRIYTVDDANPWAEALAIRDGRFVAVGAAAEVRKFTGTGTHVIDLHGRFLMPGLYDMHTHPDLALAGKYDDQLTIGLEDPSPDDVRHAILEYANARPNREWIYGHYFVHFSFRKAGIRVDRHWLDSFMPERPVAIHDRSWGCLLTNSKALEIAGIGKETRDPGNGYIQRDELTGEPTGVLIDGAYSLIYKAMPAPSPHALQAAYRDGQHFQSARGVVGTKYVHVCEHRLDALKALDDAGLLTTRVEAAISWQDDIFPVRRRWQLLAGERHYYRSNRLNANAVKFHFDGTHEARSSYLATPWPGETRWRGHLNLTREHITDMLADMDRQGIRVIAHCTGDGASDIFLDAVAAARTKNGNTGVRHQCAHSTLLLDKNLRRFAELDVTAEFSPVGWQPIPFAYARRDAFGEERMSRAYNFRGVIDAGGNSVMGTDWPVSDFDPWIGFESMITRRDPTGKYTETFYGEGIGLEEAIRVMTINGAWSMGIDEIAGSITVGKSADLVVLDNNPFDEEPHRNLHRTRVLLTIIEGQVVWDAGSFFEPTGIDAAWSAPVPEI